MSFFGTIPSRSAIERDPYQRFRFLAAILIAFMMATMVAQQLGYAWTRGQQLSENADPYGEADVLRAGEQFAREGLGPTVGLPDIAYGHQFESVGGKHDPELCTGTTPRCVYLHNPPGNSLLIGLLEKVFGVGKIVHYRFVMVFLCAAGLMFFFRSVWTTVGAMAAAAATFVFYWTPTGPVYMHGLCYHGLVSSLFFAEFGVLLRVFAREGPIDRRLAVGLGALAFVQSFFGYESIFLCSLSPIVAWLVFADPLRSDNRRKLLVCLGIAGGTFVVVQLLHLVQVAAYLGTYGAMWTDLKASFAKRGNRAQMAGIHFEGFFGMWVFYTLDLLHRKEYLNGTFYGPFLAAITALAYRRRFPLLLGKAGLDWNPGRTHIWAVLASFGVSLGWITMMLQHAYIHGHFVPRQFLLPLVTASMLVARGFVRAEPEVAAMPSARLAASPAHAPKEVSTVEGEAAKPAERSMMQGEAAKEGTAAAADLEG
jgi:hypothetical protein